jgi:CMP-N,N'-diacetyllegionaminic acid synthase
MQYRSLGIIPARGGSKGVSRKNIRLVAGKPLIWYTIESAATSELLTRFVVSTEDEEITDVASTCGAEVILRPPELAADNTPMLPVVAQVLQEAESREKAVFDFVAILQPTVPLRTGQDIDECIRILIDTKADSVISVYQVFDHHPSRMYRIENDRLISYAPEPAGRLRQDLSPVFHRNGAVYAFRRSLLDEMGTFIGPDTRPYLMPRERSINIDEEIDLLLADVVISREKVKVD